MTKEKMNRARGLIQAKRYDEARAILVTVDHPVARQWLDRLDKIAPAQTGPARAAPDRASSGSNTERLLYTALIAIVAVLVVIIVGTLLSRTGNTGGGGDSDSILAVIQANVDATRREDLAGYMATIHPQSPVYAETQAIIEMGFDLYELRYEVSGLEVLSQTATEARVAFVLVTTKISGPDFQDNEVTGVMILRLDGGQWKIYNQVIENIRYL